MIYLSTTISAGALLPTAVLISQASAFQMSCTSLGQVAIKQKDHIYFFIDHSCAVPQASAKL